jgi:asparagine synthase (glutamine-hydrolysing)
MCGVVGFLNTDGAPAALRAVERMTRAVAHRGPDGSGTWLDGAVALGHRRLAVIDLSAAAAQPMMDTNGRLVMSYNGEIYNYREMRTELQALGHQFHSTSDTEVVLAAFAEWGHSALDRFNGMFALALWDRESRQLLLARDRFGIKPMYVARAGRTILFGSEVKGLLAHGALSAQVDLEGVAEYLTFQNFFTSRTLFRDVELLPSGTAMVFEADGSSTVRRFWDFHFEDRISGSRSELIERLDFALVNAVNRQLVSDVPVGSYLSGGMDTGALTAIAAKQIPNLCSFTIGFDLTSASGLELGFDERRAAERLSYLYGTEHYEMVLKAGDMERAMSDLVWALEEPRVGVSYPNFYAAKLASRFGKVVLSGAGGDELFAGYPWRYWRSVGSDSFDHYVDDYYAFWQRLLPPGTYERILQPVWNEVRHFDSRAVFRSVFIDPPERLTGPEQYVNHSLYFEAKTFLQGLLVLEDKLSMAHGLESRVPLLDNDLVDLACAIPVKYKLGRLDEIVRLDENIPAPKTARYFAKTRDGKLILRDLMKRYLPEEIADGLKQGFSGPDASWFRGESIDYVRRRLLDRNAKVFDILDRGVVTELLNDHLEGRANRRLFVWSMLYLEEFLQTFMSGEGRGRELLIA